MGNGISRWCLIVCAGGMLTLLLVSGCATTGQEQKPVMLADPVGPDMQEEIILEEPPPELPVGYILPVEDPRLRVSSCFGERRGSGRHHKGTDLECPEGTPVRAARNGVTCFSGTDGAYGDIICIEHEDGTETAYAHLKTRYLAQNEPVEQGEVIGLVGRTGNATAFHLHFEIRKNGAAIDPSPWLPLAAAR